MKKSNEVFPSILKKISPAKIKELSNLSTNSIYNNNSNSLKRKNDLYLHSKKLNYKSNTTLTSIPKLKKEKSISFMFPVSPIMNARSLILKEKKKYAKKRIKTMNNQIKDNKNYTPLNELSFDEFSDISIDNNLSIQNFNKNRNSNVNLKQKKTLILPKMPSPYQRNTIFSEHKCIISIKILSIYQLIILFLKDKIILIQYLIQIK